MNNTPNTISEEIPPKILNSFNLKSTLVPKLWNNNIFNQEVREKLLEISNSFFKDLEIPNVNIIDIRLTGSAANYNWSQYSDIDIHIVVNFSDVNKDEILVRDYFNTKKNIWNEKHDVKMFGFDVEIYIQDNNESHTSSGLYSLINNKWLTIPNKKQFKIDKDDITSKVEGFTNIIPYLNDNLKNKKYDSVINIVDKIKDKIKKMRKSGLISGGEHSVENMSFKILRRTEFINKINNIKTYAYDKLMSVENTNENRIYSSYYHRS